MTIQLRATRKKIRILSNGRISAGDRRTHTTADKKQGGPDQVHWIKHGGGRATYIIRFQKSPFRPGSQDIKVPSIKPQTVSQPKGEYKYSVLEVVDGKELVRDDPDVIID